jgi:hypothetical protein
MAEQAVSTRIRLNGYTMFVEWDALGSTDTAEVVEYSDWPDKTIHATGTWGGATMTVEGSNDNSDWVTLTNIHGTSLSVTDDCCHAIAENTRYLRLSTTGGDTTTAVTVSFTAL